MRELFQINTELINKEDFFFEDLEKIFTYTDFLNSMKANPETSLHSLEISIEDLTLNYIPVFKCLIEHLKLTNNIEVLDKLFNGNYEEVHTYFMLNLTDICNLFTEKYALEGSVKETDETLLILIMNTTLCCTFEILNTMKQIRSFYEYL